MKIDNATRQLLKDPKKRHAWVIYQLTLQGRSLAQVADGAGVSRQCLYQVFRRTYPRMERVVADAIGLSPAELWPERYDADGLPIRRMGRPKKVSYHDNDKRSPRRRNVKDSRAA